MIEVVMGKRVPVTMVVAIRGAGRVTGYLACYNIMYENVMDYSVEFLVFVFLATQTTGKLFFPGIFSLQLNTAPFVPKGLIIKI